MTGSVAPGVRRVFALAAFLGISGCVTSTHRVDRADWGAIPATQRVRITKLDGSTVSLLDVRGYTDHIEGTGTGPSRSTRGAGVTASAARGAARQSIPLDSVEYIEIREVDVGAILVWVAGGVTAVAIAQAMDKSDVRPEASCPLVYSFDGTGFRLDSETYSGAVARALERTDVDNLDHLAPVDGTYRILMRNERPESQYTDALALLAVDHPPEVSVFPDADGQVHAARDVRSPLQVAGIVAPSPPSDLQAVASADERYWSGAPLEGADPARDGDLRDGLVLSFDRPAGSEALLLLRARNTPLASQALQQFLELQGSELVAWNRRLAADPGLRERKSGWIAREGHLQVSVERSGGWEPAGLSKLRTRPSRSSPSRAGSAPSRGAPLQYRSSADAT
ncbi:MAG: hypothetical protein FIA95_09520, partial [Gemmatimonadetes bacterium]|nr:hypothetical protein [Gemmatimonadota bacterium]